MEADIIDHTKLQNDINNYLENSVKPSLLTYIQIQNVTKFFYNQETWPEGYKLIKQAGAHITAWAQTLNLKGAKVTLREHSDNSITPVIITQIQASGIGDNINDTYFFYGHYDKQPPLDKDPNHPWTHGKPYQPEVVPDQNGKTFKIYGRGGADDGYSTYATLTAIKALQDQNIPLPKIVMITQGDQESGSGHVQYWVKELLPIFGQPKLIFCLDSGTLDYDRFWLTNSLRGYCVLSVGVKVLNEAVHSGSGSGIIPTCFRIIRQLLQRLQSAETGVMKQLDLTEAEGGIPANRQQQILDLVNQLGDKSITKYNTVDNLQHPSPDNATTIKLNTWQAQMETLSLEGYPSIFQGSNIITQQVKFRISTRLPPTKDSDKALAKVRQLLFTNPPYNAQIRQIDQPGSATAADNGFNAPDNPPWLIDVFNESSKIAFGNKFLSMGQGGSIPFMNYLKDYWPEAKFVITGLLGPQSNAHSQNQCLRFDYLKKLTACFAHVIARSTPHFNWNQSGKTNTHEHGHGHHGHGHHDHGHGHHGHKKEYKHKHPYGHCSAKHHL